LDLVNNAMAMQAASAVYGFNQ